MALNLDPLDHGPLYKCFFVDSVPPVCEIIGAATAAVAGIAAEEGLLKLERSIREVLTWALQCRSFSGLYCCLGRICTTM